ncbi:hypothetical protein JCM21714_3753 [Gracilibacillus boraciitolerans JCM 21714]|uniref:DUF8042 domain-containing protein n=1 Tax=Gracilibacillus boraciitolerans JCM 21714 TaxID=1298598 RepID=W4VN19_9BACI|nr:hypothetical protein [Gracilibacillus boraciitolerans]GAE94582.1 hypothetical protein JCM21714_3753 [Gracilibacillus boraciitolerans JCM 21714]
MEKQYEIMQQALVLAETLQEGILHIQTELNQSNFSNTMYLFEDVVHAFSSIESANKQLNESVISEELFEQTDKVKKAIELVVNQYELGNKGKVQEILQFNLLPAIKRWRTTMEQSFHPFILN